MRKVGVVGLVAAMAAWPLGAQQFQEAPETAPRLQVGIFGFGARGGVDLQGDGQAVLGVTLDAGHVLTPRLRLRPSGELSFLAGANRYLANIEMVYRFTPDRDAAVPYLGTGVGLAGQDGCGADPDCPAIWWQFVLGFEVRIREGISWHLEYHPEDTLRRHRILLGLSTRSIG